MNGSLRYGFSLIWLAIKILLFALLASSVSSPFIYQNF